MDALRSQLTGLATAVTGLPKPVAEEERQELLKTLRSLVQAVETPKEKIARMMWHEPLVLTSTRVLIDLRVFKTLAETEESMSAAQLAMSSNADRALVERLLKHVATEHYVEEVGADTYKANEITRALASPQGEGVVLDIFQMLRVYHLLPEFLRSTNYACPNDKDASPWTFAHDGQTHYFDYISADPAKVKAFQGHMEFKNLGLQWFEQPAIIEAVLGSGVGEGEVLMIDMGGNTGYQLAGFRRQHPHMPGRVILQDLPKIIAGADEAALREAGIEAVSHDFFTPQVVEGSKAYYLKMILHDWPDKECISILQNVRPAMKKGYSKILINEIVVPDEKAEWFQTSIDILMMSVHAARERRERDWRALIEKVEGLRVLKIWDVAGAVEKVIEVEAI